MNYYYIIIIILSCLTKTKIGQIIHNIQMRKADCAVRQNKRQSKSETTSPHGCAKNNYARRSLPHQRFNFQLQFVSVVRGGSMYNALQMMLTSLQQYKPCILFILWLCLFYLCFVWRRSVWHCAVVCVFLFKRINNDCENEEDGL